MTGAMFYGRLELSCFLLSLKYQLSTINENGVINTITPFVFMPYLLFWKYS